MISFRDLSSLWAFRYWGGWKMWARYKATVRIYVGEVRVDAGQNLLYHRKIGLVWTNQATQPLRGASVDGLIKSGVLIPMWKSMPKVRPVIGRVQIPTPAEDDSDYMSLVEDLDGLPGMESLRITPGFPFYPKIRFDLNEADSDDFGIVLAEGPTYDHLEVLRSKLITKWLRALCAAQEAGHDLDVVDYPTTREIGFADKTAGVQHLISIHAIQGVDTFKPMPEDLVAQFKSWQVFQSRGNTFDLIICSPDEYQTDPPAPEDNISTLSSGEDKVKVDDEKNKDDVG